MTSAVTTDHLPIDVNIGIVRDVKFAATVTYKDDGRIECITNDFLADSAYPNDVSQGFLETTNTPGHKSYWAYDQADITLTPDEGRDLIEVKDVMEARNFLMVKVGSAEWQVLAQVNWSYTDVAARQKSQMSTGVKDIKVKLVADPIFKKTKPGVAPTQTPVSVPPARVTKAASNYINSKANWKVTKESEMANKYRATHGIYP